MVAEQERLVVMLVTSGRGGDSQWFDYRTHVLHDITRVEWELGTMHVALPADVAGYLVSHGYARPMTSSEIKDYPLTQTEDSVQTGEKGEPL